MSQKTEMELRKALFECPKIESAERITIHDYEPDKKAAVAEMNLVESCDRDAKRRAADDVIQLCSDTMNIEISLCSSIY